MWLFGRRKSEQEQAKKEQAIQAVRKETFEKIDEASKKTVEATRALDKALEDRGDIAYFIFKATGGERRGHGRS